MAEVRTRAKRRAKQASDTASDATDARKVALGMLNSDLQVADEEWRRLSRAIKVLEQNPD